MLSVSTTYDTLLPNKKLYRATTSNQLFSIINVVCPINLP